MTKSQRTFLIIVLAVLTIAWLGGLVWFVGVLNQPVADQDTGVDSIVVLTGGSQRIDEGYRLLIAGKGRKLFISGVYRGIDNSDVLRVAHQAPSWVACCVVLGRKARNTEENAIETALWLHEQNFHSIRLVTANYHMPRSLLEFRRVLPKDFRIVPNPVFPDDKEDGWRSWRLAISEYCKYLFALARAHLVSAPSPYQQSAGAA